LKVTPSGAITAFPLPAPTREPLGITAGPDGNLWFGEQSHGRIGRMTTSGVLTEFPINTTNSVQGIAAGPDGNLWFGEAAPNHDLVGVMTVAGRYREFPTPTPQAGPGRPAAGPDGYMWFPELAGSIAEVAPAGPWLPTSPWYANPQRPKTQTLTTHSLSIPPKALSPRTHAGTVRPNALPSTTPANRPNPAPILSTAARRILWSLARLFP
jgi:virginiamycin B lyase